MVDFSALIQRIEAAVYENGVQAITGQILQDCLKDVVNTVNVQKQDAIYRITVTVDGTTGTPSGTARMDDETYTLELSFSGLKGETGPAGPRGLQGEKGDTGERGATGATGATGAQGPRGPMGPQGLQGVPGTAGRDGVDGVGVTDVVQTVISDEPYGQNVVTITLSNGTSKSFVIKNGGNGPAGPRGPKGDTGATGPQGPQGIQGPQGPAGVTSATVSVDGTTGTPSATATVNDGVLALSFSGLKGETGPQGEQGEQGVQGEQGPQGNTGSSVDYPYELVNNLTTDDATKGLSAAQGVVLETNKVDKVNGKGLAAISADAYADLIIADENDNSLVRIADGHIKTKNFDSSILPSWEKLAVGDYFPSYSKVIEVALNDSISDADKALFSGLTSGTLTSDGLTLPTTTPVCYKKVVVFDEERMQLRVNAAATDKILFYSTRTTGGALETTQACSHILFDFTIGRISIYQAETVNTTTGAGTELIGTDFTVSGSEYIIEIGRERRQVYAAIYNISTADSVRVLADESQFTSVNVGLRPAGWLYYYPAFMTLAGTPVYKELSISTRGDLFMLFQGDSYTEGYNVLQKDNWAYLAARYFGKSMTAGYSGSRLADIITQYHDSIKGKVDTKIMVISIGINDILHGVTTDSAIASWANTFKGYIDELVADGIIPIVNRIWPEGSSNATYAAAGKKMNDHIRAWGYDGADFGNVTGYNTALPYYTNTHLSVAGNLDTYKRFINELSKYKN